MEVSPSITSSKDIKFDLISLKCIQIYVYGSFTLRIDTFTSSPINHKLYKISSKYFYAFCTYQTLIKLASFISHLLDQIANDYIHCGSIDAYSRVICQEFQEHHRVKCYQRARMSYQHTAYQKSFEYTIYLYVLCILEVICTYHLPVCSLHTRSHLNIPSTGMFSAYQKTFEYTIYMYVLCILEVI